MVQGERVEVEIGRHVDRRGRHSEPAGHLVALAVEARQQEAAQVAAGQVVVDLQRHRALAGTHRAEAEAQQSHPTVNATASLARASAHPTIGQ